MTSAPPPLPLPPAVHPTVHSCFEVAVLRFGERAKLSGVETDQTMGTVFMIRDGKIARGREYATRGQALEAAGLSE